MYEDSVDYMLGGTLTLKNGLIDKYYFEDGYCKMEKRSDNSKETIRYYYYDQDHLGNIRQVTEVDENCIAKVVQINNYYPFGMQFCDGTKNYLDQKHKYNGKEFDNMYGLNTYDYGARQYNPVTLRWDRMDPMAEKYRETSPYVYCADNPVNRIDPDGRDNYIVNTDGNISLFQSTYDENDVIYTLGSDKTVNYNNFIIVSKSFLSSETQKNLKGQTSKNADGNKVSTYNVTFYTSTDEREAANVFEFMSKNTDVEWSNVKVTSSGVSKNYIQTSHREDCELGQRYIFEENKDNSQTRIDYAYHNHSVESIGNSPGDIRFAADAQQVYPNIKLAVYKGQKYIPYDKYDVPAMIDTVTCFGTDLRKNNK